MDAPHLRKLEFLSPAWQAAILMLDCYATIPAGQEKHYCRTYAVETLEEVAEGMMQDGAAETMSRRTLQLAALTALHSINWARRPKSPRHRFTPRYTR
jgi:hypothetical protein